MRDTWRFIDDGPGSASWNMASDEAISDSVQKEDSPPTLRLYTWDVPSVSIGYFQKIASCNISFCTHHHIPIVRRITGGRALLHYDDITYSFSVQTKRGFSKGLLDSYRKISKAFNRAFFTAGLAVESTPGQAIRKKMKTRHWQQSPLCFQSVSYGELTFNDQKVIGSAQKRLSGSLLQQGSIPLSVDRDTVQKIFSPNDDKETEMSMAGVKELAPSFSIAGFKEALQTSFEETFNIQFERSSLSREEVLFAQELEARKYQSDQWNFRL